jgi:hypothetical protein
MGEKVALHVDLQEGFDGNSIVVRINGNEAWRNDGVKTRHQIGLADSFSTTVPTGIVEVVIEQPDKHLSHTISLNVEGPTYVGVERNEDGRMTHKEQVEPFRYM